MTWLRRPSVREAAAFSAVAVALLAWLFRDAWLHGYVLGQGDILFDYLPWSSHRTPGARIHNKLLFDVPTTFYPFLFHAREALRSGAFPLWASGIGAGHPFFAATQSAVLSPFSLLTYALPFPAGFTVDVAARGDPAPPRRSRPATADRREEAADEDFWRPPAARDRTPCCSPPD